MRGVFNRAELSVVCNVSATTFRVISDFQAFLGYQNVNQSVYAEYQKKSYPGSFGFRDFSNKSEIISFISRQFWLLVTDELPERFYNQKNNS